MFSGQLGNSVFASDATKIHCQRFNVIDEEVNENPFAYLYKWKYMKENICKASKKEFSVLGVRDCITYLTQLFRKEDTANL